MIRWSAAVAAAFAFATAPLAAQTPTVDVTGPASNPLTVGIASFSVRTSNFALTDLPLRVELQVSTTADFNGALFADTTVNDGNPDIVIPRLLPSSGVVYWRAFALTARGGSIPSAVTGPRAAPTHLQLLAPNNPAGQSLPTRRPTFVWHASTIPFVFGAWTFDVRVEESATGIVRFSGLTTDTTITPANDLETNTSFRWRVIARLTPTGDSLQVQSAATFVLLSDETPLATLLHNPFPSTFPSAAANNVCIWFDLRTPGTVTLDIIDLHGQPVKRLVPGPSMGSALPAGRYGRPSPGATSGCDDRFSWDGTDTRGRRVPPGVYLVRLRADGTQLIKPVNFAGR